MCVFKKYASRNKTFLYKLPSHVLPFKGLCLKLSYREFKCIFSLISNNYYTYTIITYVYNNYLFYIIVVVVQTVDGRSGSDLCELKCRVAL